MHYARINHDTQQMIGIPRALPDAWKDGSGAAIGKFNMLPDEILYVFGWVPVLYDELPDGEGFSYSAVPVYDEEQKVFRIEALANNIGLLIANAEKQIDQAASAACARYLSTGVGQELRYQQKYEQAKNYLAMVDAGVEIDAASVDIVMIIAEAEACNVTPMEKAAEIIAVRNTWLQLAARIEAKRIGAKSKLRKLNDPLKVIAVRNIAITALKEI